MPVAINRSAVWRNGVLASLWTAEFARVLSLSLRPIVMKNGKALFLVLDQFVSDVGTDFLRVDAEQPAVEFLQGEDKHF
jgi:hypothetical protein